MHRYGLYLLQWIGRFSLLVLCGYMSMAWSVDAQQTPQTPQPAQARLSDSAEGTSSQSAETAPADSLKAGHLRLVDNLDRPEDGYCLDILGSGPYIRFDMPLSAHNCKPGLYADEAVIMDDDGKIRFPAYGACATVAGINDKVLAGAAIMPRACDERSPFLESQYLQHFIHRQDGRLELRGSGLCLTVGEQSASTFEATHRWRTLFMQDCQQAPLARSQWHFVIPVSHPAELSQ